LIEDKQVVKGLKNKWSAVVIKIYATLCKSLTKAGKKGDKLKDH